MMQQEPNSSISPANFPVPHVTGSPHPASSIDWAGIAPHVAEALLGPHNSRLSSRAEWRWGSKGSFRLRLDSGRWTDFEANARGGVLDLVLRETGRTEPADALKWLQEQGFLNQTGPQTPSETASAATKRPIPASTHSSGPERTVPPSKNAPDTLQRARQDWQNSQPIPMDADHPARRWLAARNLWWPELPLPRAVRWLPRASRWPQHEHVGAVVSLAAAPRHWQETWSKLPPLECLLYVFVDRDGRPVLDRPEASGGRDKRSRGPQLGTVVVLGDPRPGDSCGLALAEGLADALALASRGMDTAVQAVGTSGLKNLADRETEWLSEWASVTVWADKDPEGQGARGAAEVRLALQRSSRAPPVSAQTVPSADHKDPADAAASAPLLPLNLPLVRQVTREDMREHGRPLWEAARQSAIRTS